MENSNALRNIEIESTPVLAEVITFPGLKAPVKAKRKVKVGGFVAHKDYVRAYQTKGGVKFNAQVRLNGKQASKSFDTREAADTWAAERVAEFMKGTVIVRPDNIKLPALFDLYIEDCANSNAPLSAPILMMYARLKAHPVLDVRVDAVKYETALDYCKARKAEGVGPATILSEFVRVAKAIRHVSGMKEWGIDPLNKFVRARLMKSGLMAESNERTRRPSEAEKAALRTYFSAPEWLAKHDNVPMADIVDFAMISGFRRGELVAIKRTDRTGNAITAMRKDAASVGGKREALVPVFKAAWEILDRQPVTGEVYFPFNADTISGYFTEACSKLGIKDLCFHDLRHEAISTFGTKMNAAQAMMVSGHKTEKSFRRYLNLKQQDAEAIVALVG